VEVQVDLMLVAETVDIVLDHLQPHLHFKIQVLVVEEDHLTLHNLEELVVPVLSLLPILHKYSKNIQWA
jgi:hypothetical protein